MVSGEEAYMMEEVSETLLVLKSNRENSLICSTLSA